jgi:serine/threonine protein kinase/predicted esterase
VLDERRKRLEHLFHEAADLPVDQRDGYLREHCDDPSICVEVKQLLAFDQHEGRGLTADRQEDAGNSIEHQLPASVGPYKPLQQIGEGGMGVVYMAQQLEPVSRVVALKVIKPGMDSGQVIARFEAERQVLALMDHPNIAKVLDAGTDDFGRPYFVMELVKGIPITQYCDDHQLNTRERLQLFATVCRAIQHAHQKGIIHRDLKPSNVLLAEYDHQPVAKIIDFGVAKAIDQGLATKTFLTKFGQVVGTLEYMSPEQAKLNQLDVDTRSDIFSLGVLLYELLTGSTPIEKERLRTSAFDEILRMIREEEPPRPSKRLSSSDALVALARTRSTVPSKLAGQLRDDLDWILAKALAKERDERYQTAEAFAADIDRHLKDLPIHARAPSTLGRARRFLRRHRKSAILTGLILAASVSAIVLGTVAYVGQLNADLVRVETKRKDAARKNDIPRISELQEERRIIEAYQLAKAIREVLPGDPTLEHLWQDLTVKTTFGVQPDGTRIYYRDSRTARGEWTLAGQSPLIDVRLPKCELRFRFAKAGFVTREFQRPFPEFLESEPQLSLRVQQGDPEGMVHIQGVDAADWNRFPADLGEFFVDQYEVSNREYQAFVDAGGYGNPQYWRDVEFIREGKTITREQAMQFFVDSTGQSHGPAGWISGKFPPGEGDYPVSGVSWFEAMAYAKFVGKSLPTVHHWKWAANSEEVGITASLSNFSGRGVTPRGTYDGIGRFEVYDVAGNVKEWCWNQNEEGHRCLRGGAWNESEYKYIQDDDASPWDRSSVNGFRCVRYLNAPSELTLAAVPKFLRTHREMDRQPIDSLSKWYQFDRLPLDAELIQLDDSDPHPDFRHEVVHVDAAYTDERLEIHLFVPRAKRQKFETVLWVPGVDRWYTGGKFASAGYHDMGYVADLPKSGRIVCHPIYAGTYHRFSGIGFYEQFRQYPLKARDEFVAVGKDISRSVDYLLTRSDVDPSRLVYFGHSLGAFRGPAALVADTRFTAAVLLSGGYIDKLYNFPEIDNYQFTPHVTTPVLMINGVDDNVGAYESSQRPCFEDLGSEIKHHERLLAGHNPPADAVFRVMDGWLKRLFSTTNGDSDDMPNRSE